MQLCTGAEGLLWPSIAPYLNPGPKFFFLPPLRSARRPPHSRLYAAAGPLRLHALGSPFPSSTSPSPRPSPPPRPPAAGASSTWSTTTGPSASPRSTPRWRSPPCAPSTSSPPPSAPRHARRGLLLLQRRPVSGPRRELARHHPDSVRAREARPGGRRASQPSAATRPSSGMRTPPPWGAPCWGSSPRGLGSGPRGWRRLRASRVRSGTATTTRCAPSPSAPWASSRTQTPACSPSSRRIVRVACR